MCIQAVSAWGFDHVLLHDGYLHVDRKYNKAYGETFEHSSDYLDWIKQELGSDADSYR